MTERISHEEFKTKYGGDLTKLEQRLALQPVSNKSLSEVTQSAEDRVRKKPDYPEFRLQVQVAAYLNLKYPAVLFESSPINLRLTDSQRKMLGAIQKKGFHPPDMKIYEQRRGYIGLALELKQASPYLKDGVTLKKSEHLANQQASIEAMRSKGWLAGFYWNFDTIKSVLDWYLGQ